MTPDIGKIREDFPILQRKINGKPLVYLDNAASTQKPNSVINAISDFYKTSNSNVHRGVHTLSEEASELYENAHLKAIKFIGGNSIEELIFTKNTTESLNIVAKSWGMHNLEKGDEVVMSRMEHHSNLIPWQEVCRKTGASLKFIEMNEDLTLDMEQAEELIGNKTKIVSIVHVSNSLGTLNDIKKLGKLAHENSALINVDGAQSAPHMPVDVKELDCDFFAFSGHKMLGPTGIGALYGKHEHLKEMEPFITGGGMIQEVSYEKAVWDELPWKFEAGTPIIAQAIGFSAAIDYLEKIGMTEIHSYEMRLANYAVDELEKLDGLKIYCPPKESRTGIVSFTLDGIHAHDIASLMNEEGIALRAGHHCTQPLMKMLGIEATARASFYIYNTMEEVDSFIEALKRAKNSFS
ncbi:MAG: cysteine desulfurase [archaeon]|nr:cysteine desulfurase [Euryarchaeota archaeon]MDP6703986.1 cysteine desulfurase [archaeon]HIK01148.1 cysteine desulfurase [Candidatus Undinarchaeales archaeon ERR594346 U_76725]|tara:strand:+ start:81674 stop:82897 length:1224 start_codon:yes stop_codon:yes gene_type:complete